MQKHLIISLKPYTDEPEGNGLLPLSSILKNLSHCLSGVHPSLNLPGWRAPSSFLQHVHSPAQLPTWPLPHHSFNIY